MSQGKRERKKNFSEAEIDVLIAEVEMRKNTLFTSVSSGVKGTGKANAWREVTDAVNTVSAVVRKETEIKRKWFDLKIDAKKKTLKKKTMDGSHGGRRADVSTFL